MSDDPFQRTRDQFEAYLDENYTPEEQAALFEAAGEHFKSGTIVPYQMTPEEIRAWAEHEASIDDAGNPLPPDATLADWVGTPACSFQEMRSAGEALAEKYLEEAARDFKLRDAHIVYRRTGRMYLEGQDYSHDESDGGVSRWNCEARAIDVEALERITDPIPALRDALWRIAISAGIHYGGGAFDPEHMRAIANVARSALLGEPVDITHDPPSELERGYDYAVGLLDQVPLDAVPPELAQSITEFLGD